MMKLINSEKLKEAVSRVGLSNPEDLEIVMQIIDSMPAIDRVEARYIMTGMAESPFKCSLCGEVHMDNRAKHCRCGARMCGTIIGELLNKRIIVR